MEASSAHQFLYGNLSEQEWKTLQKQVGADHALSEEVFDALLEEYLMQQRLTLLLQRWETEPGASDDGALFEQLEEENLRRKGLIEQMKGWENELSPTPRRPNFPYWIVPVCIVCLALIAGGLAYRYFMKETAEKAPRPTVPIAQNKQPGPTPGTITKPPDVSNPSLNNNPAPPPGRYLAISQKYFTTFEAGNIRTGGRSDSLQSAALRDYDNGDWKNAIDKLEQLLRQQPREEYNMMLGTALYYDQNYNKAAEVFHKLTLKVGGTVTYDAQWYEFLSRLALLPSGQADFDKLVAQIRADARNPIRSDVLSVLEEM